MNRSNIGIIALTDRAWTDHYKSDHNIMLRLAERHVVIWMTPAHHWRDTLRRLSQRIPAFRMLDHPSSLTIYTAPAFLPATYRPKALSRWLRKRRLAQARRYLLSQGCDKVVLYVWRPKYADALDLIPHDVSVYHVVDEYSFSPADPPTPPDEQRLIDSADLLILHSPALLEKKGRSGQVAYVPNGVDYESFSSACAEPDDLMDIARPIIGYCGYIKHQMDWDLLADLMHRHEDYSWVFVGAVRHEELADRIEELGCLPNVHFLGAKSSDELACYPQHFDVCIMPYEQNEYTRYIFPLKLHEYLAAGRPTIGTPIRSLLDFDRVIHLADGCDEWSNALTECLDPAASTPEEIGERQRVARAHDWNALTDQIDGLLVDSLS